jgi:hypothetical protein
MSGCACGFVAGAATAAGGSTGRCTLFASCRRRLSVGPKSGGAAVRLRVQQRRDRSHLLPPGRRDEVVPDGQPVVRMAKPICFGSLPAVGWGGAGSSIFWKLNVCPRIWARAGGAAQTAAKIAAQIKIVWRLIASSFGLEAAANPHAP